MPNHITNILKAPKEVLDALTSKESPVDFETLLPRPADVPNDGVHGRLESLAEIICGQIEIPPRQDGILGQLRLSNAVRDLEEGGVKKLSDSEFSIFVAMLQSYRKHGAFFWHDWNIQNWGTKWNAYEAVRKSETSVQFDTAWKAPHPVIALLASTFPDAAIEHLWADEDIGNNYGHRTYQNGSMTEHEIKDPVDFALTVKEYDRENYRVNPTTGLWEYHDAEETETVSG